MPGAVQMGNAVQIVRNVWNNIALHYLLMINIIYHLDQGVIYIPDDFKGFCRGLQVVTGMIHKGI